eukprot:UN00301
MNQIVEKMKIIRLNLYNQDNKIRLEAAGNIRKAQERIEKIKVRIAEEYLEKIKKYKVFFAETF